MVKQIISVQNLLDLRDKKVKLIQYSWGGIATSLKEIRPGNYLVGWIYNSVSSRALCPDPEAIDRKTAGLELTEGLWTGEVITPLVEVRIVGL